MVTASQEGLPDHPPAAVAAPPGYVLEGELARGGMGVVYRARQVGLNRPCALKMMLGTASGAGAQRFLAEAEAIAAVKHPQVVQVYDFGRHAGGPYLAMEFCPGGTLADKLKAGRLTPTAAAALLAGLAEAVGAAHAAGVVHRDLKPGNVLFDAAGVAKVADFGLAKRDGGADLTRTEALMGTPAYMSPEQAKGEAKFAGPPADVWALGVILYECLTGARPFAGESALQVMDRVIADTPTGVRTLAPDVPRDLELIGGVCLRKEPHERYATAALLAADLRRFLAGEPVKARPVPAAVRAWKWVRRHPGYAGLWAGLAAALVLGTGLSAWQADRATREADRAGRGERDAEQALRQVTAEKAATAVVLTRAEEQERAKSAALAQADDRRKQTVAALDALTDDVVQTQLARRTAFGETEKAFVKRVIGLYEQATAGPADAPDDRSLRALGLVRVADLRRALGDAPAAVAEYQSGLALFDGLAADFPDRVEYRRRAARNRFYLAWALKDAGRLADAEAAFRTARAAHLTLTAGPTPAADDLYWLAGCHADLAALMRDVEKYPEAEKGFLDSLAVRERLKADHPDRSVYSRDLAVTVHALGLLLRDHSDRPEVTEAVFRRALEVRQKLVKEFPDDPDHRGGLAGVRSDLGRLIGFAGRTAEAETEFATALGELSKLAAEFPAKPEYREYLGTTHYARANVRMANGRRKDAEADFQQAVTIRRKLAVDQPGVPDALWNLAAALSDLGDLLEGFARRAEAEPLYRESLGVRAKLAAFPPRPVYRRHAAITHHNLGLLLQRTNRPAEADEQYRAAQAVRTELLAERPADHDLHNTHAWVFVNRAILANNRGDPVAAVGLLAAAAPHHAAARSGDPEKADYRRAYGANRYQLLRAGVAAKSHAGLPAAAAELVRYSADKRDDGYAAACFLATGVKLVATDGTLPGPIRHLLAERYADLAVGHLRAAITDHGWANPLLLRIDTDLDPLRGRADFRLLAADLERKTKKPERAPPPRPAQ